MIVIIITFIIIMILAVAKDLKQSTGLSPGLFFMFLLLLGEFNLLFH